MENGLLSLFGKPPSPEMLTADLVLPLALFCLGVSVGLIWWGGWRIVRWWSEGK